VASKSCGNGWCRISRSSRSTPSLRVDFSNAWSVWSYPKSLTHTFVSMNTSSRSSPDRWMPSATCRSLKYDAAVSMCRYPAARAVSTAAAVSSGGL